MSDTIRISASMQQGSTNSVVPGSANITVPSSDFVNNTIQIGTAAITPPAGNIGTPGRYLFVVVSGDKVLATIDNSNYHLSASLGMPLPLFLDAAAYKETQTITTVADASDSLDGTYLTLQGNSGTWAIWIDTDDSGTAEPSHGMNDSVEVTGIVTDDTAAAVAAAIYAALIADADFMADFYVEYDAATDDDLITITDRYTGTRTNLADTGSTGFTVATTQAGAAFGATVKIKSEGNSIVQCGAAS